LYKLCFTVLYLFAIWRDGNYEIFEKKVINRNEYA